MACAPVDLAQARVTFAAGQIGGGRAAARNALTRTLGEVSAERPAAKTELDTVAVSVRFTWRDVGPVLLDGQSKPTFASLPEVPGLVPPYNDWGSGSGAAEDPTSVRPTSFAVASRATTEIQLRAKRPARGSRHSFGSTLDPAARYGFAVATEAQCALASGQEDTLDLSPKAGRLLAENAAPVLAWITGDADIENLG